MVFDIFNVVNPAAVAGSVVVISLFFNRIVLPQKAPAIESVQLAVRNKSALYKENK